MNNIIEIITADTEFPSPYSHRVLMVLHEKNIPYQVTAINPYEKPQWFLDIAPLGQVPVMRLGETVLPDSRAIIEYIDSTADKPLLPKESLARSQHYAWFAFADEIANEITQLVKHKKSAIRDLKRLNQLLAQANKNIKGNYFFGTEISLVDIALVSHILWINALEEYVFPFSLLQQYPKLYTWFKNMKTRRAVQETAGPNYSENFIRHLKKRGLLES